MMKKYLILGLLALALLALPAAVAAEDKAQTEVTGSVTTTLSVSVKDASLDLGAMDVGYNPQASPNYVTTTVTVTATGPLTGWTLTAKDKGSIKTGWLLSGATYLYYPLEFTWGVAPPSSWSDLTIPRTINSDTWPFVPTTTDVFFRQKVIAGDPAGSYSMIVEFNVVPA